MGELGSRLEVRSRLGEEAHELTLAGKGAWKPAATPPYAHPVAQAHGPTLAGELHGRKAKLASHHIRSV